MNIGHCTQENITHDQYQFLHFIAWHIMSTTYTLLESICHYSLKIVTTLTPTPYPRNLCSNSYCSMRRHDACDCIPRLRLAKATNIQEGT